MPESTDRLQLYHFDGCYFCTLVRDAARELGTPLELRSIRDNAEYGQHLMALRGRRTVPVLRIESANGAVRWLPESHDIVCYLRKRAGAPEQAPPALERAAGIMSRAPWILLGLAALAVLGKLLLT